MIKKFIFFVLFFFIFFSFAFSINLFIQRNNIIYIKEGFYIPLFKENEINNIYVKNYFIDIYSVTNIEYRKFIKNNIFWNKNKIKNIFSDFNYLNHWNKNFKYIQNSPIVNVSWYSCNEYCKLYNKRLPTIDEWEYIVYRSFNENNNYIQEILNWYTKPVKPILTSRESINNNCCNVYGMNGIIWEWVKDFNSIVIIGSDSEGGDLEQLLFCGTASVNSVNPSDYVSFMRFSFRSSLQAKYNISSLGFRCVKDI